MADYIYFKVQIFADEDPALYSLLKPMEGRKRGRVVRAMLRDGLAFARGAQPMAPSDLSQRPAALDISDLGDPNTFTFGPQP